MWTRVWQLGGSDFRTGGLSAKRVLKKRGTGAGEPVWLSGRAGLARGVSRTLRRKTGAGSRSGIREAHPHPQRHPWPCTHILRRGDNPSHVPHQKHPFIKLEIRKSWNDVRTPEMQLRGRPLSLHTIVPRPHPISEVGKTKAKRHLTNTVSRAKQGLQAFSAIL